MIPGIRYAHTNLVARDWRRLAAFYTDLFGCVLVPPERDLKGEAFERGTGIPGARAAGAHLRLPGAGGPTLEIFQYEDPAEEGVKRVDRPGFGHIAFAVDDVATARAAVLEAGGAPVGELVATTIAGGGRFDWCYVTDPEGNIVELQRFTPPG